MVVYKFEPIYNLELRLLDKYTKQPESVEYRTSQGWWGFPAYRVGWDPKHWSDALMSTVRGSETKQLLDKVPVEALPLLSWLNLVLRTRDGNRDAGRAIYRELRPALTKHANNQLALINIAALRSNWSAEETTDRVYSLVSAYEEHIPRRVFSMPCYMAFLALYCRFPEDWSEFVPNCNVITCEDENISFREATEVAYELKRYMVDYPFEQPKRSSLFSTKQSKLRHY